MTLQDPTPTPTDGNSGLLPALRRITPNHAIATSALTAIGTGNVPNIGSVWALTAIAVTALLSSRHER
ncbi:hypothetical protein [Streptomyces sp. WG7]|uniref:hypothetical protein n=1 Tax=Streptomyces sp. WG7 TaxID=3417650 RepID=UPI003CEAC125